MEREPRALRIDALHEEHLKGFREETDMSCPFVRGGLLISAAVLAHRGELTRAREAAALVPMNWAEPALPEALHGFALLACGDPQTARHEAEQILAEKRWRALGVRLGRNGRWEVHPEADAGPVPARTTFLSPFDRLIHDRDRAEALWGFR